MRNAYIEVLTSYWDRCLSSWSFLILALFGVMQILIAFLSRAINVDSEIVLFLAGEIVLSMLLWIHFREQANHEFRRLAPNYVRAVACAFTGYSILLVVVWPTAVGVLNGVSCITLLAVAVGCFAMLGWWILTMSWWLMGAGFVFSMLLVSGALGMFGPDRRAIHGFFRGSQQGISLVLLAIGVGAVVAAVVRMLRLREDDSLYNRRPQLDNWSLRPRMTGEVNQVWREAQKSRLLGWPNSRNKLMIPATDSLWQGARRWRSLNAGIVKFSIMMATIMTFSTWLPEMHNTPQNPGGSMILICFYLTMMPVMMTGQSWMRQWRFLETEMLRPITRHKFLQEIGLAMGITVAQCWGVFAAIFAFRALVLNSGPTNVMAFVLTLGGSMLLQVFLFATIVWLLRYRSPGAFMGVGLLVSIIGAIPILVLAMPEGIYGAPRFADYQVSAWMAVIILAGAGWVIARDAWRRWLIPSLGKFTFQNSIGMKDLRI